MADMVIKSQGFLEDAGDNGREEINIEVFGGKGTISVYRTDEGIVVDIFRNTDLEPVATTYAFESDFDDYEEEDEDEDEEE